MDWNCVAELLRHPVYEWLKNFSDIQCLNGCRISTTPVYEWLQSLCDIQCMSGRRISATSSDRLFADYIDYLYIFSKLTIKTYFLSDMLNLAEGNINFEFILNFVCKIWLLIF